MTYKQYKDLRIAWSALGELSDELKGEEAAQLVAIYHTLEKYLDYWFHAHNCFIDDREGSEWKRDYGAAVEMTEEEAKKLADKEEAKKIAHEYEKFFGPLVPHNDSY
jgi:hypothetical protein